MITGKENNQQSSNKPFRSVAGNAEGKGVSLRPPVTQKKENNSGLPDQLKTGIETLSGFSMYDVQVHYHSDKPAQLHALAYAQGTDIHIAPGQERHLPHEAWHVVQQKQGRVNPTSQIRKTIKINDDKSLENEADTKGNQALQFSFIGNNSGNADKSLAKKTIQSPLIQGAFEKDMDINGPKVRGLRVQLVEMGIISGKENTARFEKLKQLIINPKNFEISDIISELMDVAEDSIPDKVIEKEMVKEIPKGLKAVVLWAGSKLTSFQIGRIKKAYKRTEKEPEGQGVMDKIAGQIHTDLRLDPDDEANAFQKKMILRSDDVQQALEQEVIHAEEVNRVVSILSEMGASIRVFRPADDLLIRPHNSGIHKEWDAYRNDFSNILENLKGADKTIVVTIGHGHFSGATHFASEEGGLVMQEEIQRRLGLKADQKAVMYIPLQCYPLMAVAAGQKIGWHSDSIPEKGVSSDGEMRDWIRGRLGRSVAEWLSK